MTTEVNPDLARLLDVVTEGQSKQYLNQVATGLPFRFRFNSLKHSRSFQEALLRAEGFAFSERPGWAGVFETDRDGLSIGKSLSHFLGHLYIQDLASMAPVSVLAPERSNRVLDLCAAPGSKTTQLAEWIGPEGLIVANDPSTKRIRSLVFNLRRMGLFNAAVLKAYGEPYGNQYFEFFDGVLLDAPCSALGTLGKSPEVVRWWTPQKSERLSIQQRSLLSSGLKALRPGGVLIYSTCTVAPQENEVILAEALEQFPIELEPIQIPGLKTRPGLAGFEGRRWDSQMLNAVRIYPHENACEGFFIARIRKTASFGQPRLRRPKTTCSVLSDAADPEIKAVIDHLDRRFGFPDGLFQGLRYTLAAELNSASPSFDGFPFHAPPVRIGLPIAHVRRVPPKLTTEGAHLLGDQATRNCVELSNWQDLFDFANRCDLLTSGIDGGQVLVRFQGHAVGHGWLTDESSVLSRFPRTGWRFGMPIQES
jgi:NOL1/NOP2/sun family putative RNA methylase